MSSDFGCRPADQTDVAKFFIANYLTRAVTVVVTPGTLMRDTTFIMVCALYTPLARVGSAFRVIARCEYWTEDDLRKAHKAGTLYTLVKFTRDAGGDPC